jgi:hypothetical protein
MLRKYSSRLASAILLPSTLLLLTLCGCVQQTFVSSNPVVQQQASVTIHGMAHGGLQPIKGATVQLYAVGTTSDGGAATALLTSTVTTASTGNPGSFSITGDYTCPSPTTTPVYITITGGDAGGGTNAFILLMQPLARAPASPRPPSSPSTKSPLSPLLTRLRLSSPRPPASDRPL